MSLSKVEAQIRQIAQPAGGEMTLSAGKSSSATGGIFSLSAGQGATVGVQLRLLVVLETAARVVDINIMGQALLAHQAKYIFELQTLTMQMV